MSESWYVETLLKNQESVWQNVYRNSSSKTEPSYELDLYDEDYNNLLRVQKQIKFMANDNLFSSKEILVLGAILAGKSIKDIEKEFGLSRITVSKIFSDICDRIALILGREFTNDGYLDYIKNKHKLSSEQVEKARNYMQSNKRHALMRGG